LNTELLLAILGFSVAIHLATHVLAPFNLLFSKRFGIVARPDERRVHALPTPEAGGLSFALPVLAFQILLGFLLRSDPMGRMLISLAGVGFVTLLFGVLDDKYESRARYKLLWQIALAVVLFLIGFRVDYLTNPLGADFQLGWLSFPVTIIWYLMVMNAINLIDGIDGLAAGICVIVSAVLLVVGIQGGSLLTVALSSFLIAGNLAFLFYNFHPAKIFLGDTGALFNGLIIAAISTAGTQQFKGVASMTLMIPLSALAIPLLDVALAVFRRLRMGNIFSADKAHLHHAMLAFGLSQKAVSIIVYIVTLLFGLIAIGFSLSSKRVLFLVLLGLLMLMVVVAYILMRLEKKE
jgi:UDP-GlcNAc:undecaprenyl-phosphate GlcNAc-1-phosphate transferase